MNGIHVEFLNLVLVIKLKAAIIIQNYSDL